MRAECVNNTEFQGRLVILGEYSKKPKQCIAKVSTELENLIKPKGWNLYIKQDFSANNINIVCEYIYPFYVKNRKGQINLPITSKSSRYIDAAKDAIALYERNLYNKEQKDWELKQKKSIKETLKDAAETAILIPLSIIDGVLFSINPKWANKFEKYLDKINI